MNNYEQLYQKLVSSLTRKNRSTMKVEKAYLMAREAHKNQRRIGGEPYIVHPLEVALILEDLNFDADVLAAALLHDVVEDCGITIEKLAEEFGSNVAEIVNTVSAIEKETFEKNDESLYVDQAFEKQALEEQTFKKLIKLGKKNPAGFYVKFADRIHNLRTIGVMPYYKQLEKVRETERWILPIAEILKSNYFYREIKNECFKIEHSKSINDFLYTYANYYECTKGHANKIKEQLISVFYKDNQSISVVIDVIKEYEIYEYLKQQNLVHDIKHISNSHLNILPFYNIYVVWEGNMQTSARYNQFFNNYYNKFKNSFTLIGGSLDEFSGHGKIIVKDESRNMYNIYLLNSVEMFRHNLGTEDGIGTVDEFDTHEIVTKFIKVKSRSNEIIFMPENSTVLDFAFKIHQDIGFAFKYAIINDSPQKFPPYTKINDGDTINIITSKDENMTLKNNAELKWLAYVQTESAKRTLIKYFEKKLRK